MNEQYESENKIEIEKVVETLPELMGERIAFLRKKRGMTQAQLAEQLGLSAQAVSKWEGGSSCPDITILVPLANLLDITTDVLLSGGEIREEMPRGSSGFEQEELFVKGEEPSPCGGREIHSLRIELKAVEAFIRQGDEFALDIRGYGEGACKEEIRDGVWIIKDSFSRDWIFAARNLFRDRKVIITVPRDHPFQDVSFSLGAGTLTAEGIRTENSRLNIGAGELSLADFESGPCRIKVGMGSVKVKGVLKGLCRMDCGMGSIDARLIQQDCYGYDVKVGMGEVRIGEDSFSGMGGRHKVNAEAEHYFDIDCGMGSVKVKFDQ